MGRAREKREKERHFIYYDLKVSGSKGSNEMGFAWNNSMKKKIKTSQIKKRSVPNSE